MKKCFFEKLCCSMQWHSSALLECYLKWISLQQHSDAKMRVTFCGIDDHSSYQRSDKICKQIQACRKHYVGPFCSASMEICFRSSDGMRKVLNLAVCNILRCHTPCHSRHLSALSINHQSSINQHYSVKISHNIVI